MSLPDNTTQDSVVNHIQLEHRKVDQALILLGLQIENLKEYKTALINSAVTGKIKVTPEMVES